MKVHYTCDQCGADIDTIDVSQLDEEKLGFNILTNEERQQMLFHDKDNDVLYVKSICNTCIDRLELDVDPEVISRAAARLLR